VTSGAANAPGAGRTTSVQPAPSARSSAVLAPRLLALVALLLTASGALADTPPRRGPLIGARLGWAIPQGDVARAGPALEDVVDGALPIALDLGYRFNRRIWGQLYIAAAPATAASAFCSGDCSAADVRFGVEILLRLAPGASLDPWIGIGAGIELLQVEGAEAAGGTRREWNWAGIEIPFEAGLDVALGNRLSLGPYLSVAVAQFTAASVRPAGGSTPSESVKNRATHAWLAGGLKATLRL
jgi:hypothetical protein